MSDFNLFFRSGIEHIADIRNYYPHILFLISLFVLYPLKLWGKILLLITAFTLGHCASLVLIFISTVSVSSEQISFFIPAVIFLSSWLNLHQKSDKFRFGIYKLKYVAVSFYSFIQGTGFNNELKNIAGEGEKLIIPFIAYNLGIESGQFFIILIITMLSLLAVDLLGVNRRDWVLTLSGITIGTSLILMIDRFPW